MPRLINAETVRLLPAGAQLERNHVSYQSHESRDYDGIAELAEMVRRGGGGTLSGDSGIAPMIALLSGAEMAGGEGDTNVMRFQSGMPTPAEFIRMWEREHVEWLVIRYRGNGEGFTPAGLFSIPEFLDYAEEHFEAVDQWRGGNRVAVVVLRRKGGTSGEGSPR